MRSVWSSFNHLHREADFEESVSCSPRKVLLQHQTCGVPIFAACLVHWCDQCMWENRLIFCLFLHAGLPFLPPRAGDDATRGDPLRNRSSIREWVWLFDNICHFQTDLQRLHLRKDQELESNKHRQKGSWTSEVAYSISVASNHLSCNDSIRIVCNGVGYSPCPVELDQG